MARGSRPPSDPGAHVLQRVGELEAENARLRRELAQADGRRDRLLVELQHRVRNLLGIVRSVARRSVRAGETAEEFAMHLDGRLAAIARTQAMIVRDPDRGIVLDDLLAEELLAHAEPQGERVVSSGPPVRLTPRASETLGLALHELVGNAVEHGALSEPGGHLAVTWRIEPAPCDAVADQVLRLEWKETGAPLPDASARRRGFGTELIERTLPYQLSATTSLDFDREGVRCTIVVPLTGQVDAGDRDG